MDDNPDCQFHHHLQSHPTSNHISPPTSRDLPLGDLPAPKMDIFEIARTEFMAKLKHPEQHAELLGCTSLQAVLDGINDIQEKGANAQRFRNLSRIRPYLDRLNQFSGVIEVFVQAKADVLSLIWVSACLFGP
jgi:hypothetical protein